MADDNQPLDFEHGSNVAFVMNVSGFAGAESFELAPGHVLRRANDQEISEIKKNLDKFRPMPGLPDPWEWERNDGLARALPKEQWRYFVIHCRGLNHTLVEIEKASKLAEKELKIAFTISGIGPDDLPAVMWHPGRLFYRFNEAAWGRLVLEEIGAEDTAQINTILDRLQHHDNGKINVDRLVRQLLELDAFPPQSELTFLGYFGVLESMLTHKPEPSDPYQSITRQVKKKVALFNRRFNRPLDYAPFQQTPPDTVWTKMYSYRSILAHGDSAAFDGELQTLGNHARAMSLLEQTVKAIIRQALIEPELVADLREC